MRVRGNLLCLLCAWLAAFAGASEPPSPSAERDHRFQDAERWAERWNDPSRREWQKPLVVLEVLAIEEGEVIADLGAGTGYFTALLWMLVGDTGKVYAVDIEQSMLDFIKAREDIEQDRIFPILAAPDDPRLPEGEVDLVLTVNTWHHIEDRPAYLGRLARALGPSGRLALIDYQKRELPHGPPPDHKLSRDEVVREFEEAGWRLVGESVALPYQYFLTFYPPRG